MAKGPECFHFSIVKSGTSWKAEPLKGDDQPAAGLDGAEAATLDQLAKSLGEIVKAAKGETGRITCNQLTPSKALFTSTIGGIVVAGGAAPVAAAAAGGGGGGAAAAKAPEPEPEPEEEEASGFDLFD